MICVATHFLLREILERSKILNYIKLITYRKEFKNEKIIFFIISICNDFKPLCL